MIRAIRVQGQHRWNETPADTVVLDFDDRHRRRMAMTGTRGLEFLLDLENAVAFSRSSRNSSPRVPVIAIRRRCRSSKSSTTVSAGVSCQ